MSDQQRQAPPIKRARASQRIRRRLRRALRHESLEQRQLLAGDFHNALLPLDVSNDEALSPLDALMVVNDLNENGARALPPASGEVTEFIDTNGDDFVSPVDALLVINVLNTDSEPPEIAPALVNDSGADSSDGITNDPRINGNVVDPAGVKQLTASIQGVTTALELDAEGNFEFSPTLSLDGSDDGQQTVQLEATDTLGQVSTNQISFTLDTIVNAPTLDLQSESDSGVKGDRLTTFANVDLEGSVESGAAASIDGKTVEIDSEGNLQASSISLDPGVTEKILAVTDLAGNESQFSFPFARIESESAFGLIEGIGAFVQQTSAFEPTSDGSANRLRINLDTKFDFASPSGIQNDLLNIFVVDANSPSDILLSGSGEGSPVASIRESGSLLTPGVTSFQGDDLLIDLSTLNSQSPAIRFELLSLDEDTQSFVVVESMQVEQLENSFSEQLNNFSNEVVRPSGTVALSSMSTSEQLAVTLSSFHSVSTETLVGELVLRNGGEPIGRDLGLAIKGLPDSVVVLDAETADAQGNPILNLRNAVPNGGLASGQSTQPIELRIQNPNNLRFQLDFEVLTGPPNSAPTLAPITPLILLPGDVSITQLVANDVDGDSLTYSLAAIPADAPTFSLDALTGKLEIRPEPDQLGDFRFEILVSDGAAQAVQSLQVEVRADNVTSTRLTGRVLDTNKQPIPGIAANIGSTATTTDAEGNFFLAEPPGGFDSDALEIHGNEFVGNESFPFVAEKLPLLFPGGRDLFPNVNNAIDRPIYLPALDVDGGTTVDPTQDVTVTQDIAPGEPAEVFVAAGSLLNQQGNIFNGVLSITEVPRELTPAALPPGVFPGTVVTIQPGEMVFQQPAPLTLPNRGGFPAGTEMDLFSINPITGVFDNVGTGIVSQNGQAIETVAGGIRNSSWHFFTPTPTPEVNELLDPNNNRANQNEVCNDCEGRSKTTSGKNTGTSEIELHSGALRETHVAATYQSLGVTRGVVLQYNSLRASPQPIVHFGVNNAQGDFLVAEAAVRRGEVSVQIPGAPAGEFDLTGGEMFWQIPSGGQDINAAFQVDLSDQATGTYSADISFGARRFNGEAFIGVSEQASVPVSIVNSSQSPFGAGWDLGGFHSIAENPDGSVLLVEGLGNQLLFEASGSNRFSSPAGDFTSLIRTPEGTFERITPERTVYRFNLQNQLESVTDRNGNITTFTFDEQGRLTGFIDPVGLATTFSYEGERISTIRDPQGRVTALQHDASGNLTQIQDADSATRRFEYDQSHRMIAETNQRGFREQAIFGFHGRVVEVVRKDGGRSAFNPVQTTGLFPNALLSSHVTAPLAVGSEGLASAVLSDPNGNVNLVELDQAGQVREQEDAVGDFSRVIRDDNNLTIASIDARGNGQFFKYDESGKVTRISRSVFDNPVGIFPASQYDVGDTVEIVRHGDFDGDGDEDLIAAGGRIGDSLNRAERITVLENVGDGRLMVANRFPTGASNPTDMHSIDVDGDDILDVVVATSEGVSILLGNGDLTFANPLEFPIEDTVGRLAIGDADGDNDVDIFVARDGSPDNTLLRQQDDGSFAVESIATGANSLDATFGDFNGDGFTDIAVATTTDVLLMAGQVNGGFAPSVVISNLTANYSALVATDLNRDGKMDLVAGSRTLVHEFVQSTGGRFEVRNSDIPLANSAAPTTDLAAKDLDGDKLPEILFASQVVEGPVVLRNVDGQLDVAEASQLFAGVFGQSVSLADLDGDGDVEAILGHNGRGDGGVTVVDGARDGSFNLTNPINAEASATRLAEWSDLNGDGFLDQVLVSKNSDNSDFFEVQTGRASGEFDSFASVELGLINAIDLATGDFDGNGKVDIAFVGQTVGDLVVSFQDVDGTFEPPTSFSFGGRGGSIESIDINEDGMGDLVAVFSNPRRIVSAIGQEDRSFSTASIEADFNGTGDGALSLTDFGQDGVLDAVGVTPNRFFASDNAISLTISNDGSLGAPQERQLNLDVTGATSGDLNNDGLPDLIAFGKGISVRLAEQDGSFGEIQIFNFDTDVISRDGHVVDLDGDGNLDVAVVLNEEGQLAVLRGDGTGALTEKLFFGVGTDPDSISLGDFDLDGDLDGLVSNGSEIGAVVITNSSVSPCTSDACEQSFQYDNEFSQLIRSRDASGRERVHTLDPNNGNRLASHTVFGQFDGDSTETDDLVTQFTYTDQGQVAQVTDALGRITEYQYDQQGNLTSETYAVGTPIEAIKQFEYDAAGNRTAEIDEVGNRTEFEYDLLNRRTLVRDALGNEFRTAYDPAGNIVRQRDPRGNEISSEFDSMDRIIASIDALGHTSTIEYDRFGNTTAIIDRLGRKTSFVYDSRDRLIETIDAEGNVGITTYDGSDNLISSTDANGNVTKFAFDGGNRNTVTADALGSHFVSVFDPSGLLLATIDPLGRRTDRRLDDAGRLVELVMPDPDGSGPEERPIHATRYDAVGNIIAEIDPLGNEHLSAFDERNRLVKVTEPDPDGVGPLSSPETNFVYDTRSNLIEKMDPLGRSISFEYDVLGQKTRTIDVDPDGDGPEQTPITTRAYDELGNLVGLTDALGNQTVYLYDAMNRLVEMQFPDPDGDGPLLAPRDVSELDAEGQLIRRTDALGRSTQYEYDRLGRNIRVVSPDPDGSGPLVSPVTNNEFDGVGNLISIADPRGNRTEFVYDQLNRQIQVIGADPDGSGPLPSPISQVLYDAANQIVATIDPLGRETNSHYDGLGRIVIRELPDPDGAGPLERPTSQFRYDIAGRLISTIDTRGNETSHEYDNLDRLTRLVTADPDGDGPLAPSESEFVYDAAGQNTEIIDPRGNATQFEFDGLGRIVRTIQADPDGAGPLQSPTLEVRYDLVGNEVAEIDSLGNTTFSEYDNLYRKIREISPDPDGAGPLQAPVLSYAFDAASQLIQITDPLGRSRTREYDDLGRLTKITRPDPDGNGPLAAPQTSFSYDAAGNQISSIGARGFETRTTFDALNRPVEIISPDPDGDGPLASPINQQVYDSAGQLVATIDPLDRITTFRYDGLGRNIETVFADPDGDGPEISPKLIRTFDASGNEVSSSNALGHTISLEYDALNRLVTQADELGANTRFEYDENGNRTAVVDPSGNRTEYTYDGLNRLVQSQDPLGATSTLIYDSESNLIRSVDRLGRAIEYEYDNLYRPVSETWLDQGNIVNQIQSVFDISDQRTSLTDQTSSLSFEYDSLGQTISETTSLAGFDVPLVRTFAFDVGSNLVETKATFGNVTDVADSYTYDNLNRATRIAQTKSDDNQFLVKTADYQFDAANQLLNITSKSGSGSNSFVTSSNWNYDGAGRVSQIEHNSENATIARYQWTHDADNRPISFVSLLDGTANYQHDARDQLTDAEYDFQSDLELSYDENGNRVGDQITVGANNQHLSDEDFTYEYDAEGNRTKRTNKSTGEVTEYDWDHRNRLVQIINRVSADGPITQQVQHSYDAMNRWVGSNVDTDGEGPEQPSSTFRFYNQNQMTHEFAGSNPTFLSNRYWWGLGTDRLLAADEIEAGFQTQTLFALPDNLGTVRDLVSHDESTGATKLENHRVYDAYGNLISETDSSSSILFGFSGRPFDDSTGLQNNLNRWYEASTGLWVSEDPIGFSGGDANLSRYVGNSPLTSTDPSGLTQEFSIPEFLRVGEIEPTDLLGAVKDTASSAATSAKNSLQLKVGVDQLFDDAFDLLTQATDKGLKVNATELLNAANDGVGLEALAGRNAFDALDAVDDLLPGQAPPLDDVLDDLFRGADDFLDVTDDVAKGVDLTDSFFDDIARFGDDIVNAGRNLDLDSFIDDLGRVADNVIAAADDAARVGSVANAANSGNIAKAANAGRNARNAANAGSKVVSNIARNSSRVKQSIDLSRAVANSTSARLVDAIAKTGGKAVNGAVNLVSKVPGVTTTLGFLGRHAAKINIASWVLEYGFVVTDFVNQINTIEADLAKQAREEAENFRKHQERNVEIRQRNKMVRQLNAAYREEQRLRLEEERALQEAQDAIIIRRAKQEQAFIEAQRAKRRKQLLSGILIDIPPQTLQVVPDSFKLNDDPVVTEFGVSTNSGREPTPLEQFFLKLRIAAMINGNLPEDPDPANLPPSSRRPTGSRSIVTPTGNTNSSPASINQNHPCPPKVGVRLRF